MIDLAIILEGGKIVQGRVSCTSIVAIQEDPDDKTRSYLLLISGHDMHVDLDYDTLRKMVS